MPHAMVTIIAPIALDGVAPLQAMIAKLGNPADAGLAQRLAAARDADGSGTHFASLHAIASGDGRRGHLVLEFSADGTDDQAIDRLAGAIAPELQKIFAQATDWPANGDLKSYLHKHVVPVGYGWFSNPGICFPGTPGMKAGQVIDEADLAKEVSALLKGQPGNKLALERLNDVRAALANGNFRWALKDAPAALPDPDSLTTLELVTSLVVTFARTFLWPLGLVLLLVSLLAGAYAGSVGAALSMLLSLTLWSIPVVAIVLVLLYVRLLADEKADETNDRAPDPATLAQIAARENRSAQNHMLSVTYCKPGLLRAITLRGIFWIIGELVTRIYRPGFLDEIGTIHFARWVTPPGTRDLLFFSNYGGSWESYLEDFITRASRGLTGVWSNAIGFPRTSSLILQGATDGERFKRYARQSMLPTLFWYTAYPSITTSHIRTNAKIRRGLANAKTNEDAQRWLSLFGSVPRPAFKLESSDIQSLVFGGLGFLPCGACLFFDLPEKPEDAQTWIASLTPFVAFNDGRRLAHKAVVTIGMAPRALEKLQLPPACTETFPPAFLEGMPKRAAILGDDIGDNAVKNWRWGCKTPDVVLLVYGETDADVADLTARIDALGVPRKHGIPLKPVESGQLKKEPFGFVDGISQPLIRGSYKALRDPSPLHVVEPGEFLIGYPDNRGNIPPAPTLAADKDLGKILPIAASSEDFTVDIDACPRDLARNGTFLVIRQLEQDVPAFYDYCMSEAARYAGRLGPPYNITQEYIAAKLVGRWKDGSSLVRHPYMPADEERQGKKDVQKLAAERNPHAPANPTPPPEKPPEPDNDFLLGEEDPEGLRCPYGAHVRRANPRDSLEPGSLTQVAITNRHRLLRVGRFYEHKVGVEKPGLLFMCLNGDIERQFEFIQQTWLNSPTFHGLVGEQDPIVGPCDPKGSGFVIPTRDGPIQLSPLSRFVTTLGGGYFFLPGKRLLRFLAAGRQPIASPAPAQRPTTAPTSV